MPTTAQKVRASQKRAVGPDGVPQDVKPLGNRERAKIVQLLKSGLSRAEVAERVGLSQYAVDRIREAAGMREAKKPTAKKPAKAKR